MGRIDLGKDEGYVHVTIENVEVALDLFDVHTQLTGLGRKHEGNPNGLHQAVVELLKSYGFPTVSHRKASQFILAMLSAVDEIERAEKKTAAPMPTPGLPDFTAPVCSNSPPVESSPSSG